MCSWEGDGVPGEWGVAGVVPWWGWWEEHVEEISLPVSIIVSGFVVSVEFPFWLDWENFVGSAVSDVVVEGDVESANIFSDLGFEVEESVPGLGFHGHAEAVASWHSVPGHVVIDEGGPEWIEGGSDWDIDVVLEVESNGGISVSVEIKTVVLGVGLSNGVLWWGVVGSVDEVSGGGDWQFRGSTAEEVFSPWPDLGLSNKAEGSKSEKKGSSHLFV